ncbi:MAG TPA: hypothetical protein IAC47_00925 [Candidatus Onthomorpha intestinigallinarum]|uniref:Uncharacterized protein n=1 Tax=Candidatus Onthomorpha intestinigallinarum TaxID=2840880 RepID=A0A9D1RHP4_9BACT|nr:hypothetical protein [Candidatus Onthomorpha intestinigallinarum]
MRNEQITPATVTELKDALVSKLDGCGYTYFQGDIRKGGKYVHVRYYFLGVNIYIQITYWQDGLKTAIGHASTCRSAKGAVNKIAKFLNLQA